VLLPDYWSRIVRRASREALAVLGLTGWAAVFVWLAIFCSVGFLLPRLGPEGEAEASAHWFNGRASFIVIIYVFVVLFLGKLISVPAKEDSELAGERQKLVDQINAAEDRTEPMPPGFVTVRRAVERLVEKREKGKMLDGAGAIQMACEALESSAIEDRIQIWGHTKNSPQYEPMLEGYWQTGKIDVRDLLASDGSGGRTELKTYTTGFITYLDLCVNPDLLVAIWPEDRKSGG
jgi:hypothetical protein